MSNLYFDTSAIVKRYTNEIGSVWLTNYIGPASNHNVSLCEIIIAEFAAALSAKQRIGVISVADRALAVKLFLGHCDTEYQLLAATRTVINRTVELTQRHPLRGYDAVQLATALVLKETLFTKGVTDFVFLSADKSLLVAAQAEGLVTETPNAHP